MTRRPGLAAAGIALIAAALAAFLSQRVFEGIPHVADGVSYAFQGRIFAAGRLWLDPPPVPEAFHSQNVLLDATRWCGIYPPGYPLLLAPGWLAGTPWLVNPLLLGLAVLGVFRLGKALSDGRTGLLAALLLAVSPFALLMGASFMGHVAALAAMTWCLAFLAEGVLEDKPRFVALAGAFAGSGFVARPQAAVFLLLPALAGALLLLRRSLLRSTALLVAGAAVPLGLLFAYNYKLSENPFRMAYLVWNPDLSYTYGFSLSRLFFAHFPWFLHDLNATLWGFPWGDLAPLLFLLWPAPGRTRDAWLAACALSLVAGFSGYRYYEINHSGPRYAFEALGVLAVLSSRALLTAAGLFRTALVRWNLARVVRPAGALAVGVLAAVPLSGLLPEQARALSDAYHAHTAEPMRRAAAAGVGPSALVLVSGNTAEWTYGSFLLENGLDPRRAPRVFARDLPGRRDELLAAYPREQLWSVRVTLRPRTPANAYIDNTWDVVGVEWNRLR